MRVEEARWADGWLMLKTADVEARHLAYQFKPGFYTISKSKEKRSLDANAYAWVIIGKIAAAVNEPKTEVYRRAIKEIGDNYITVCVKKTEAPRFKNDWERQGLGWIAEEFPSKIQSCVNFLAYSGSSSYERSQMSRLIDILIQDAKALDIETMPPDRLESLLGEWGA